MLNMSSVYRT